jgi:acyl dehydratase
MPIRYPQVLALRDEERRFSWTPWDTMLYALAVGAGSDPAREGELGFVLEDRLRALPTLATVVAWGAGVSPAQLGIDRRRTLHGAEHILLHRLMPAAGEVIARSRVAAVYDKGDKGAIIERETVLEDVGSGDPLVTLRRTAFARADGGFGGPSDSPPAPESPDREPDRVLRFATRPDQALLYRLCGDRNPLHSDPEAARQAGFAQPILHGLCTFGICCRGVLEAYCGFDPSRLAEFSARFSAPVVPGDDLEVRLWRDGGEVAFDARVPARDAFVIKGGRALLRPGSVSA